MHPEYSYFRAAGLSLEAIETAEQAKEELARLKRELCRKVGAEDLLGGIRPGQDHFVIIAFFFDPEKPLPEGWVPKMNSPGFATPPPGSAEAFLVASMCGLMERHSRRSYLEEIFGCGEMPKRNLPAGSYDTHFIRWSNILGVKETGYTADPGTTVSGSSSPMTSADPLTYVKIADSWYIRVPNDDNGKPRFTPPDAEPKSFAEMIDIDQKAHQPPRYPWGRKQFPWGT